MKTLHGLPSAWWRPRDVVPSRRICFPPIAEWTEIGAAMRWTVTLTVPTLLVFHEAGEVSRAPSLAQLAQRLRLDLANPFACDGE